MDNSSHRQETDSQQQTGYSAILHLINRILDWLAGLIKLTEGDQKDAGIYLGDNRND